MIRFGRPIPTDGIQISSLLPPTHSLVTFGFTQTFSGEFLINIPSLDATT